LIEKHGVNSVSKRRKRSASQGASEAVMNELVTKRRLWAASKLRAGRSSGSEFERMATARRAELGEIGRDTMIPICEKPEDISIMVAGGAGSHSVFVPVSAHTKSVTKEIMLSE
jgi:hypothetical protein